MIAPPLGLHRFGSSLAAPERCAFVVIAALAAAIGVSPFFFAFYSAGIWVPAALGLVVLAAAAAVVRPRRPGTPGILALVGLGGLALWSLASASWADSVHRAVVEANRWTAYAVLFGLLLLLIRGAAAALWLIGTIAVLAVAVGGVVVAQMLIGDARDVFLLGRLNEPLGYINGQAAFFLMATWPFLAAAEQRNQPVIAGAAVGAATLLTGLVVLSQSRGAALAAGVAVLAVVALVPGRLRRMWALVGVGVAVAVAMPALLDVYQAGRLGHVPGDVGRRAALTLIGAALGSGVAWGAATAAVQHAGAARRRLRQAAVTVLVLAVGCGVVFAAVSAGRIADTLDAQYSAFVHLDVESEGAAAADAPATRLISGVGGRYDFWRIAWAVWKQDPLVGVGAGNYVWPYYERRRTDQDVRQPHSAELQVLSELGVIGAGLLVLFAGAVAAAAWRGARSARGSPIARALSVAAIGSATAWFVHASVDWLHLLPGVTAFGLAAAAVLVRSDSTERSGLDGSADDPPAPIRTRPPTALAAAVALGLVCASASLTRQAVADLYRGDAEAALRGDPRQAVRDADRALRLTPEDVTTYYVKAAALARLGQATTAQRVMLAAARREPRNFVTWALLGDLAVRYGDLRRARQFYQRALRFNRRDRTFRELARDPARARIGEPATPALERRPPAPDPRAP